jgi:hypothetical protein
MKDLIAQTNLLYMRAIVEDWPLRRLYWRLLVTHLRLALSLVRFSPTIEPKS